MILFHHVIAIFHPTGDIRHTVRRVVPPGWRPRTLPRPTCLSIRSPPAWRARGTHRFGSAHTLPTPAPWGHRARPRPALRTPRCSTVDERRAGGDPTGLPGQRAVGGRGGGVPVRGRRHR